MIAQEYGLADRASIYRHAHALGLFLKRQRNVRVALERIIERAGEVDVTAAAVVAEVQAYSKINATGQWIDRSEHVWRLTHGTADCRFGSRTRLTRQQTAMSQKRATPQVRFTAGYSQQQLTVRTTEDHEKT